MTPKNPPHPFSYQEILAAMRSKALQHEKGLTLVTSIDSDGVDHPVADLPWTAKPTRWMLPFLLCLEKHGREDCFCWWNTYWDDGSKSAGNLAKLKEGGRPGSRYIGWKKSETYHLLSHPVFAEPWQREKQRALQAYLAASGKTHLPLASASIPWAERLVELVRNGCSPSGAGDIIGLSRGAISHARKKHPELDNLLSDLGHSRQTWRGTTLPEVLRK